jgi:outer membrane protein TolC
MCQFNSFLFYFRVNNTLISVLLILALFCLSDVSASDKPDLSLAEAERLALEDDPMITFNKALAGASLESAIADRQLADPTLTFGLFNVPINDFELKENPTTQFRMGIKQALPRGDTLHYQSLKRSDYSKADEARAMLVSKNIVRDVRLNFLESLYQQKTLEMLTSNRRLFVRLLKNTEDNYSVGASNQQQVLQAKLALSRLDAEINQAKNKQLASQALLSKWLPDVMSVRLEQQLPKFSHAASLKELQARLVEHPLIAIDNATINAAGKDVSIAKEQFKPKWNVGVEYRKRFGEELNGDSRDDMMAAMVTVDMPFFTENRQDRRLAASQHKEQAAKSMRAEHLRELQQQLNRYVIDWQQLKQREELYQQYLLPDVSENKKAAISAYQNRVIPFSMLIQAYILELETQIKSWRVSVERTKAQAQLLYLTVNINPDVSKRGVNHE